MKKIILLLPLLIFGCLPIQDQSKPDFAMSKLIKQDEAKTQKFDENSKFDSRELATPKSTIKKVKVGVLLPLSGKNRDLGQSLLNTIIVSLFDNDEENNIELIAIDTREDNTKEVLQKLEDKKIKLVLGPVFGSVAELMADDFQDEGIISISFSNNPKLIGKIDQDGGVFLAGFSPETEIDRIVSYSLQKGKMNFAAIAPNNQYGFTITNLLKKISKGRDGNFIVSEFYETNNDGKLDKVVERVINSFSVDSKFAEGGGAKGKSKKTMAIEEVTRSYPQIIMIPDTGKNLSKIVSLIKQLNKDERDFQIIGTSQWDDITVLNDPNLLGSWFAAPENERFRSFEKLYYQTYGKFPPRIASIAYDSMAVIARLVEISTNKTVKVSDFTSYKTAQKEGFEGIDGMFRFLPNGVVQRNLAVLEVKPNKFETIDKPFDKFLKY